MQWGYQQIENKKRKSRKNIRKTIDGNKQKKTKKPNIQSTWCINRFKKKKDKPAQSGKKRKATEM